MNYYDKFRLVIDVLSFIFMVGVLPMLKLIHKIKTNDLRHIDAKLDDIKEVVDKTDAKLDRHLEWHLNHQEK